MTFPRILLALGTLAAPVFLAVGVSAQDSNTLNRHLEHQQWQRVQDHQNQMRTTKPRERHSGDNVQNAPDSACSADALPAADRRRMEVEYVRRVKADGKASADAWVREQGRQFRLRLVAEGVCPDPSGDAQAADNEEQETGEDGCRMVMRPVAGLGGAAMTMAMVPDCD